MEKVGFFNINIRGRLKCIFICSIFISFMMFYDDYDFYYDFFWFLWCGEKQTPNNKYLPELIKKNQKFKKRIFHAYVY